MKWCLFIILTVTISNCDPTQQKKPPKAINGILDLRSVTVLKQNPQVTTEQPVSLDTAKEHVVSNVEPWNFEKDGVVKLDGEWEFYWKELLAHEDFQKGLSNSLISKSGNINVPGSWRGYEIKGSGSKKSEIATGDGYATFRLKVLLPQTNDLSLKLKFFGTAYELFIDGKSVAKNGIVGKTRANSVPDNRPLVIPIKNSQNEIELILQCSNFHGPEAGFWYSIILGETDQV
ncbi:MAG: hypothetical protein K8R21_15645, partial [Leptospira sp.]|nr:hypothetical protein [Leptospira sp.]